MSVDSRAAIRDVAIELFAQLGYEKTSLREIADRVGMTKASLYYHYPSKQALLLAIVDPLLVQWRAVADQADTLPHTPDNARLVLGDCIDVLLRHRAIAGMFHRDAAAVFQAMGPVLEDLLEINRKLHEWLAGPEPSSADRVRAIAALEVMGAALGGSPFLGDVSDDELRSVLLDAANGVLRLSP